MACPNQRAATAPDFGDTTVTAKCLRRFPRCHGSAGMSAALAEMTAFNQRRSFFMAVILSI
jgi:hypothetical protein